MGLTNAPSTHQGRLEEALGDLINTICVVYLDDIVVFSNSPEEHLVNTRKVLQKLREANLYCSKKKTKLFREEIKFLGHWISSKGIRVDNEKVEQVLNWKTPRSSKCIKKFLGTVQWMKKFIWGLEKFVGKLTPLTSSKLGKAQFHWGQKEDEAFNNIKRLMTSLPHLKNIDFDSEEPLWLFTDASGSGLGAALFQGKEWKLASPVAYESRKMTPAERNYPVHEQELLAVIHALQKWRMLLLGMKVNVMSDHHSLTYLLTQKTLSRRQARWIECLAAFDVEFKYIRGEDNSVADSLSRKDIADDDDVSTSTVACVAGLIEVYSAISPRVRTDILTGYSSDAFYQGVIKSLPLREDCALEEGFLFIEKRRYIPTDHELRQSLMDEAHRLLGHLGYLKTVTELRREFFWPRMARDVENFVKSCDSCQRIKSSTQAAPGRMLTPSIPRTPLVDLAIDFIGPLPKVHNYDMLLTCTCRLLGFTRLIPTCQTDTAERVASRFFSGWVGTFGSPRSIISDRDKIWTSTFWKILMKRTGTDFHLTTAFHPQADGQSERTNRTVGPILRSFTSKRQGKWLEALPAVEFAINAAVNISTGKSPSELVLGRRPHLFESGSEIDGPDSLTRWLALREDLWTTARDNLWVSRVQQAVKHTKRCRDVEPMQPDSWALLNAADWSGKHTGGVSKLREKFEGPYRVVKSFNHGQNVELDLPVGDC